MPRLQRRQFLQFAGSTLTTLGLNQLSIIQNSNRYARVLAQSTPRKLALLVGINQYPPSNRLGQLKGCVTDVELQRELLVYRFGFNRSDILSLTDAQATHQGILEAFEEHLIKQAKPGDVVVFHFSGHGSEVTDSNPTLGDHLNSTFVPVDNPPPSPEGIVQDIMGRTLFLLITALKTENVTVVLDCCHSGGIRTNFLLNSSDKSFEPTVSSVEQETQNQWRSRGNLRVRYAWGSSYYRASPTEHQYQKKWLSRLNLSVEELLKGRREPLFKGVTISSAQRTQVACDAPFDNGAFYAGVFTYTMTRYLWQQTGSNPLKPVFETISRNVNLEYPQEPLLEVKIGSDNEQQPVYFTAQTSPPADGVVTKLKSNQVTLWLGGLDPHSLKAFDEGATFTIVNRQGHGSGEVKLESRQGLIGQGTLSGTAQEGALLQEATRVIPSELKLRIGLDPSLGTETEAATQALQKINRIEPVPFHSLEVLYTGEVQYILSRMTATDHQEFQQRTDLPAQGSIGLFSLGRDEIIPGSFGTAQETAQKAVSRLETKLKSLLAARIVKMTLNANSSQLDVEVAMTTQGQGGKLIAQAFTARGSKSRGLQPQLKQPLLAGTPIQFQVRNNEPHALYLSIILIEPSGSISVLFPNQWRVPEETTRLEANQTLLVPNREKDEFQLVVQETSPGEVLVIASRNPLSKTLVTLQSLAAELKQQSGPLVTFEPIEVMGEILADLSGNCAVNEACPLDSSTSPNRGSLAAVQRPIRTSSIAVLSIQCGVMLRSKAIGGLSSNRAETYAKAKNVTHQRLQPRFLVSH